MPKHVRSYSFGDPKGMNTTVQVEKCFSILPRQAPDGRFLFFKSAYRQTYTTRTETGREQITSIWHATDPGLPDISSLYHVREGKESGRYLR